MTPRSRSARPAPPRSAQDRRAARLSRFTGRVYRQTALRVPACVPPAETAPHAGRYHGPGDPWPLYGALDEATIWAEWAHATGGAVRPEDDPRWRCIFEAELDVLDLRDELTRAALGTTLDDLVASWAPDRPSRACRRVMAAAIAAGADAIIVPSAALPGGWSIDVLPHAFEHLHLVSRDAVTPTPPTRVPA
jgi:hypothetical protein